MEFQMRVLRLSAIIMGMMLVMSSMMLMVQRRQPSPASLIVYQGYLNGRFELYVMWEDGSHPMPLAEFIGRPLPQTDYYRPRWSPEFHWIVAGNLLPATGTRGLLTQIVGINVFNGQVEPLTGGDRFHVSQSLSPDGEQLVFMTSLDQGMTRSIGIVQRDGSGEHLLTDADMSAIDPAWSPDGRWIAFALEYQGENGVTYSIAKMRSDGSELHALTDPNLMRGGVHINGDPAWSPDGKWIAFAGTGMIYKMRPDGTDLQQLTDRSVANADAPVWSPDGKWIALIYDSEIGRLYRMRPDGTRLTPLGVEEWGGYYPHYSPLIEKPFSGGKLIAFGVMMLFTAIIIGQRRFGRVA